MLQFLGCHFSCFCECKFLKFPEQLSQLVSRMFLDNKRLLLLLPPIYVISITQSFLLNLADSTTMLTVAAFRVCDLKIDRIQVLIETESLVDRKPNIDFQVSINFWLARSGSSTCLSQKCVTFVKKVFLLLSMIPTYPCNLNGLSQKRINFYFPPK